MVGNCENFCKLLSHNDHKRLESSAFTTFGVETAPMQVNAFRVGDLVKITWPSGLNGVHYVTEVHTKEGATSVTLLNDNNQTHKVCLDMKTSMQAEIFFDDSTCFDKGGSRIRAGDRVKVLGPHGLTTAIIRKTYRAMVCCEFEAGVWFYPSREVVRQERVQPDMLVIKSV